jgi:hypothetical protein
MNMQYVKVNLETGLFEEDALLGTVPVLESGEPDPTYINVLCPPGFYWPRWNFETQQWEEGGVVPDPVTPQPTLEERNRADIDYLAMMMEVML